MRRFGLKSTACLLLICWLLPAWAFAQENGIKDTVATQSGAKVSEAEIEELTREISETTMSPFCPGRTLSACPSAQARELRLQVKGWLEEGQTREQIRERLLAVYGEGVRGTPKAEGFGLMAWLVPVFITVFAFLAILYVLRGLKSAGRDAQLSSNELKQADDELRQQVEKELKRRLE